MSLKSSTQKRQSLDLRSLPTESEIDNAYDLAYRIVQQMRVISCYRISYSSLCSIGFAEAEGLEKAIAYWKEHREDKSDILESLLLQLETDSKQLQDLFSPLWRLFQVYAFADLGDFVSNGHKWGRCAYPAIQSLAYEVQAWGRQCISLYRIPKPQPIDSELRKVCEQQEAGFPLSFTIESDLRERLFREQGRLIKGLLEAQALNVATNPAVPSEIADVEKIRQDALLASLSKKNRYYVFCGRIWSEYRREQEALILEGSRIRTREGVQIEEAFPIAKANGWPEDQLDEFIQHAKEGIRKEKPWTDFVKGSKGTNIPLKKFLT